MDFCLQNNIILFYMPTHTTQHLQPLDVALFSPLDRFCREEQDNFIQLHPLYTPITKANFIPMCEQARERALTPKHIISAFEKAGVWPVNKQKVLRNPDIQFPPHHRITNHSHSLRSATLQKPSEVSMVVAEKMPDTLEGTQNYCNRLRTLAEKEQARTALLEQEVKLLRAASKTRKSDRRVLTKARVVTGNTLKTARMARLSKSAQKGDKRVTRGYKGRIQ